MGNAYWPVDGRELTSVQMDRKVHWDSRIIEKCWTFDSGPPDDSPEWLFVGETDDHERLWAKVAVFA